MPINRSAFNIASPNQLRSKCDLAAVEQWFQDELQAVEDEVIRQAVAYLGKNLDTFVRLPSRAILFWNGCDRLKPEGKQQKIHKYPEPLKNVVRHLEVALDTRSNGPAIASFLFSGGERPKRFGTTNSWSIHHLYSGKFPYIGRRDTLHAQKDGRHFTQSAGLVAVHPLADALSDEYPAISWLLRLRSFQRFGYDPDHVFTDTVIDEYGFARLEGLPNYNVCLLTR